MSYRELLLGCGHRRDKLLCIRGHEDWSDLTTLDSNPDCKPDVLWDLGTLAFGHGLPFEDGWFDEVHAYEVLEHLGFQGAIPGFFHEFSEYHRILKPGGHLFATVPDWKSMWAWGDPSHARIINAGTLAFLSQAEYAKQVGRTPMSDYRHIWKGDFEIVYAQSDGDTFSFVLKAIKGEV